MYHFRTNPPSRQIAPTPTYSRTYYPLHCSGDARSPVLSHPRSERNAELIGRIVGFCERHRIAGSTFGKRYAGDPRLIPDLAAGRKLRTDLADKLDAILSRGGFNA